MSHEIVGVINDTVAADKERYAAYTFGLLGMAGQVLNGPDPTAPRERNAYEFGARRLSLRFASDERASLERQTLWIAQRALESVPEAILNLEQANLLRERLLGAAEITSDALIAQAGRDANVPKGVLMQLAIRTDMLKNQPGQTKSAALALVRQQTDKLLEFKFIDRAGRRWDSLRYIETLVRGHYLTTYNETVMYVLAANGHEIGQIVSDNQLVNGVHFRFAGAAIDDLMTYEDMHASVFHPNSDAIVVARNT